MLSRLVPGVQEMEVNTHTNHCTAKKDKSVKVRNGQ